MAGQTANHAAGPPFAGAEGPGRLTDLAALPEGQWHVLRSGGNASRQSVPRAPAWLARHRAAVLSVAFLILILAAWQLCASLHLADPIYTSSPQRIAVALYHFLPTHAALEDLEVSGVEFGAGLGLAIVGGVSFGLLLGRYPVLDETTSLSLNIFYSMPLIALAPILVLWFGIGVPSKIAVVFTASFFPILLTTQSGVRNVDRTLVDLARSYRASEVQIWRTVLLPGAVPSIVTGIRLGMVMALIGVVVGEFIASSAGLGYLVSVAANNFNIDLLFVGLTIIAIAAMILTFVLRSVERRFNKWRTQ
jgi:ABC-type nitrate/sulfonate/bicarbonate transport system permease component